MQSKKKEKGPHVTKKSSEPRDIREEALQAPRKRKAIPPGARPEKGNPGGEKKKKTDLFRQNRVWAIGSYYVRSVGDA